MEYIKSYWYHKNMEDPFCMLYEIDENREIHRIIEIFKNNSIQKKTEELLNSIEIVPLPSLNEINSDKQFYAFLIDEMEFNQIWSDEDTIFFK